ncbi:hypothetical protein V496_01346 [Pseudogymnoascus sp. VKM F-4515 (FW-2607)]|nr:hypothetical protein V496_01346 [Pseudogymnoascus sp. VKM F-4515 (FW-2607)]KFY94752.1 hypothetical protein V498_03738 [Pseudogymnoascus sp. VKM F-4517 (FW-2822)]
MANDDMAKPSQEILEILIAHGWDINTQGPGKKAGWSLLWHVVEYPDLVKWFLDHSARVDIPNIPPQVKDDVYSRACVPPLTILGMEASLGSVEAFELLLAEGAFLDPRTLHRTVE